MIHRKLEMITEADLQALVDDQERESRDLEYKRETPDKRKLLKAVAAFANTVGGDLILGIQCPDGADSDAAVPEEVIGLESSDADAEARRIEQMLRSSLDPALDSVRVAAVPLENGRTVLIVRVFQSWQRPHRVKESEKFYGRAAHHVYNLSVPELRRAFVGAEGLADRIRRFVADRLIAIRAGETLVPLEGDAHLVLHLIPLGALEPGSDALSTRQLRNTYFSPLSAGRARGDRPTLEGHAWWFNSPTDTNSVHSLVHLHRCGVLEAVDTGRLSVDSDDTHGLVEAGPLKLALTTSLREYLQRFMEFEVHPPAYLFLSLLGARRRRLLFTGQRRSGSMMSFGRDSLTLPEVILDDFTIPAEELSRNFMERLANACGTDIAS